MKPFGALLYFEESKIILPEIGHMAGEATK